MFKSQFVVLCLCFFAVGSYANLVPFIDKCKYDDADCMLVSSQKALQYFAAGLPEFGVEKMEPIKINQVKLEEGELNVLFKNFDVSGTSKCKLVLVKATKHSEKKFLLQIHASCPIDVKGDYTASGKLFFVPIEGDGPFHVQTNNIFIAVDVDITIADGKDGKVYWKLTKATHTYEAKEKTLLTFENMFNGDEEKARPIQTIFNENWKEIMASFGKPIVHAVIEKIVYNIKAFLSKVPIDQLVLNP